MKTFRQFMSITEAYYETDKPASAPQDVGKVGQERKKSTPEIRRMSQKSDKGKQGQERTPSSYKPRSDIGTQRQSAKRVQQPTQERGSAALSFKEAQRKARLERKAREAGAKTKTATELLSTKTKAPEDKRPADQPKRAVVGISREKRKQITRDGHKYAQELAKRGEAERRGTTPDKIKLKNLTDAK